MHQTAMTNRSYSDHDWARQVIADDLVGEGRGRSTERCNRDSVAAYAEQFLAGHDLQQLAACRDASLRWKSLLGANRTTP